MKIPLCDLQAQYAELKSEIDSAVAAAISAARYILGPNVKAFENEVADYLGVPYAVGLNSGTDALHLALRALDIGPGDEVITSPFTFIATSEAIAMVGATPVFVDIDPRTFCIDAGKIEAAITPRTRAILPVHLYGHPCDMQAIVSLAEQHDLRVIEDCAQSMGARYRGRQTGTIGDVGCFSFFPSKNLGCMGDGGMLVTKDENVYQRVEMLRRHGGKIKYHHSENGVNSRLDELQAAVLRVKLPHLDRWNERRIAAALRYNEQLVNCPQIAPPPTGPDDAQCVFHQYTVQTDQREMLAQHLSSGEVGSAIYYPVPLHLQEVNRHLGFQPGDFPVSESVAERCLSLPMHPHLEASVQTAVINEVKNFVLRQHGESCAA